MSGVRTPSLRLSRTMTRAVPPSRRKVRSWSSAQICVLDCHTSSRTAFARVAERQDEEPRTPVLPRVRVADHRAIAVIDLGFLARCRRDHDARLRRRRPAERHDKAAHARIASGEAVIVDEVLPDGHGVATSPERLDDQLSIRLARTRRTARLLKRHRVGGHLHLGGRFRLTRVGGYRRRNGRICATKVGGHRGVGNGRFRS
jgi:hypothetical protein